MSLSPETQLLIASVIVLFVFALALRKREKKIDWPKVKVGRYGWWLLGLTAVVVIAWAASNHLETIKGFIGGKKTTETVMYGPVSQFRPNRNSSPQQEEIFVGKEWGERFALSCLDSPRAVVGFFAEGGPIECQTARSKPWTWIKWPEDKTGLVPLPAGTEPTREDFYLRCRVPQNPAGISQATFLVRWQDPRLGTTWVGKD